MNVVLNQSLAKLICANCKKYLSYFPIYIHPNKGSFSGRWQGITSHLYDHFTEKHPTFILRNAQFELDFRSSYVKNFLLPFENGIFIVNRTNDSKTNIFTCTVSYFGTNLAVNDYYFKIVLENERKSHTHVISKKLNVRTDVSVEHIRDILINPSSIIANIQILEHAETINNTEVEKACRL